MDKAYELALNDYDLVTYTAYLLKTKFAKYGRD